MKERESQEYSSGILTGSMTQPHRVVLHRSLTNNEWVTHLENLEKNPSGGYRSKPVKDYYYGCYFKEYKKALENYKERCKYYGVNNNINRP